eukprot:2219758-Rhodomonas_salina.4
MDSCCDALELTVKVQNCRVLLSKSVERGRRGLQAKTCEDRWNKCRRSPPATEHRVLWFLAAADGQQGRGGHLLQQHGSRSQCDGRAAAEAQLLT